MVAVRAMNAIARIGTTYATRKTGCCTSAVTARARNSTARYAGRGNRNTARPDGTVTK